MRWGKSSFQANEIGNALDEASWSSTLSIVLEAMDHFVSDDTGNLVAYSSRVPG